MNCMLLAPYAIWHPAQFIVPVAFLSDHPPSVRPALLYLPGNSSRIPAPKVLEKGIRRGKWAARSAVRGPITPLLFLISGIHS